MALSSQEAVSDGTLATLAVSLEYFSRAEITVTFDGAVVAEGAGWVWVGTTDKQINFSPNVPNGVTVKLQRRTAVTTERHSFSEGAAFKATTLDENFDQIIRVAQEQQEGVYTPTDVLNNIDMHGFTLNNLPNALLPGQPVTLAQVLAADSGAVLSTLAGAAGASLVGGGGRVVSSIAALRALDKTQPAKHAFVTGYYAQGDGGGGAYWYDSTDTTSADNGGTTIVATDGGRWKLAQTRSISVKQFGAKGDGIAQDAPKIQAAMDWVGLYLLGGGVFFPPGIYLVNQTLTAATDGIYLYSDDRQNVQLRRATDYGPTIKFSTNTTTRVTGGGVQNLTLYDSNGSMTVATSPAHIVADYTNYISVRGCAALEGCGLIRLLSANNTTIDDFTGSVFTGTATGKSGIYIGRTAIVGATNTTPSITWLNKIDLLLGTGVAATTCMDYGLNVEASDGLWIDNFHAFNTAVANLNIGSTTGGTLSNIYAAGVMLDHCGGYGLLCSGTSNIATFEFDGRVSSLGAGGADKHGIAITSPCQDVSLFVGVEGFNASGIYIENANANDIAIRPKTIRNNDTDNAGTVGGGIWIKQANRISISGGTVGGDGKQDWGIRLGDLCNRATVSGVNATDNGGVGLQIDAGADYLIVSDCNLTNNPSGGLLDNSSGNTKLVENCLGFSPLRFSAAWDPGNCANGATVTTTIAAAGVALGDFVSAAFSGNLLGLTPTAYCVGNNVVVLLTNNTGGATDLAAMTVHLKVEKRLS